MSRRVGRLLCAVAAREAAGLAVRVSRDMVRGRGESVGQGVTAFVMDACSLAFPGEGRLCCGG